jgi:hypothetical protein
LEARCRTLHLALERQFDYQLGNSGLRFPKSRYYWLVTGRNGDPRLAALNIGITPEKLPRPGLDTFKQQL